MTLDPGRDVFYLLCNAESEAERSGLICGGGWDPPLTRDGIHHLRRLCRRLTGNPLEIRTLICSPLLRSVQAADIAHDVLHARMIALPALSDRNFGFWERRKARDIPEFDPDRARIPDGEDFDSYLARISEALIFALEQKAEILIVTQQAVAKTIARILGISRALFGPGVIYRFEREAPPSPQWNIQIQFRLK